MSSREVPELENADEAQTPHNKKHTLKGSFNRPVYGFGDAFNLDSMPNMNGYFMPFLKQEHPLYGVHFAQIDNGEFLARLKWKPFNPVNSPRDDWIAFVDELFYYLYDFLPMTKAISESQFKTLLKRHLGDDLEDYDNIPAPIILDEYQEVMYDFDQAFRDYHAFHNDTHRALAHMAVKSKLEMRMQLQPSSRLTLLLYNYPRAYRDKVFAMFAPELNPQGFPSHISVEKFNEIAYYMTQLSYNSINSPEDDMSTRSPKRRRTESSLQPETFQVGKAYRLWEDHDIQDLEKEPVDPSSGLPESLHAILIRTYETFVPFSRLMQKERVENWAIIAGVIKDGRNRTVVPRNDSLIDPLVQLYHNSSRFGHRDLEATIDKLTKSFLWHNMRSSVKAVARTCISCMKDINPPLPLDMAGATEVPDHPLKLIGVTHISVEQNECDGFDEILLIQDKFSQAVFLEPAKASDDAGQTWCRLAVALERAGGLPESIITSSDARFGGTFEVMVAKNGVKHMRTTEANSEVNEGTERMQPLVLKYLLIYSKDLQWVDTLKSCEMSLNTVPDSVTKYAPHEIMYSQEVISPLDDAITRGPKLMRRAASQNRELWPPHWAHVKQRLERAGPRRNGTSSDD